MKSIINWKTGTPEEQGSYLVMYKYVYEEDIIFNEKDENVSLKYYAESIGCTYWDGEFWSNFDSGNDDCKIVAWCKITDIKPIAKTVKANIKIRI